MGMRKYGNRPNEIDGYKFDSLAESRRYHELKLLENNGDISHLRVHPRYVLQQAFDHNGLHERAITYEGDFEYYSMDIIVCEDVKGFETEVFKIKRKLFIKKYPDICLAVIQV
jgi:hypothetical protein